MMQNFILRSFTHGAPYFCMSYFDAVENIALFCFLSV